MPNWCEGSLRIRGTLKQIKTFAEIAFSPNSIYIEEYGDKDLTINLLDDYTYINGTRRAFCSGTIYAQTEHPDQKDIAIVDFKQAWDIESGPLLHLAKESGVDLRIYAFECGMQFNREIEIIDGEIIEDNVIQFDDYNWECPCPNIGG